VRWGIGHSIGLVVVGSIFIFISSVNEGNEEDTVTIPHSLEIFAECLVGLFMLILGSYQMYTAFKNKSKDSLEMNDISISIMNHSSDQDKTNAESHKRLYASNMASNSAIGHQSVSDTTPIVRPCSISDHGDIENMDQETLAISETSGKSSFSISNMLQHSHFDDGFHDDYQTGTSDFDGLNQSRDGVSARKQFIAICIGIIHGVAGPGGVLGVIPAVQLHDLFLSTIYLGTFCCCSTLTMGVFAACYGYISSFISGTNADISFRIEVFSAGLSIFVGALWLFLLAIGKLEDIFP
jgi:hypothetical protein